MESPETKMKKDIIRTFGNPKKIINDSQKETFFYGEESLRNVNFTQTIQQDVYQK